MGSSNLPSSGSNPDGGTINFNAMKKDLLIARLQEEFDFLNEKYTRLITKLNSDGFEKEVGETQMNLLLDQESAMRLYLRTLSMRIEDLSGDAKEEPKSDTAKGETAKKRDGKDAKKDDDETPEFVKDIISVIEKYLEMGK